MIELESFHALDIASSAETAPLDEYEDNIPEFRRKHYTYIPMPASDRYYHVFEEELREIHQGQYFDPELTMMDAFERLLDHPFLLCSVSDNWERTEQGVEEPESGTAGAPDDEFMILTLADVNKRRARELFYHVISEFEIQLARLVSEQYPDSLIEEANDDEVERWYRAKLDGLEMHIAEHMYLSTLLKVCAKDSDIREQLGYDSRNQFDKDLGGLNSLRHKVMHPTRALVHNSADLERQLERVRRAQHALETLDRGQLQPRTPRQDKLQED